MATKVSSITEIYEILRGEIESRDQSLSDFNDGAMLDILAGAFSVGINEISELTISEFKKTFFDTSHGPEITNGNDDLQTLAVDHYGDNFKRPEANEATGSVTFSRNDTGNGDVTINIDTVVKTAPDSLGEQISFKTTESGLMTGLFLTLDVIADIAGSSGNVDSLKVTEIETTLTDSSVTVANLLKMAGGTNEESDSEYRETIRNLIQSLAGATKDAILGAILSVSGVSIATLIEVKRTVIDYDISGDSILAGASYFRIPYPTAYIADSSGSSSQGLIDSVHAALEPIRACGVYIEILGATAVQFDWNGSITLNAGGPNFAELSNDPQRIIDSMSDYVDALDIGTDFIKGDANSHILSIWGPSGTNDITSFNTNVPVANTSVGATDKLVSNIVGLS